MSISGTVSLYSCFSPTFSPMKSMGASSRSPSPMTTVPAIGTVSRTRRMASTAAWSDPCRSPRPMVRAAAIAASSTTRTNSSDSSSTRALLGAEAYYRNRPIEKTIQV